MELCFGRCNSLTEVFLRLTQSHDEGGVNGPLGLALFGLGAEELLHCHVAVAVRADGRGERLCGLSK